MAGEEDVELRDLVAQTLEARGVLGKIRAELRASVFLALEEQEAQQKPHPLVNQKLQQYLRTKDGQVAAALVREFLEFFNLDFTAAVFDPESNVMESYPGRAMLAKDLSIDTTPALPLLASVVDKASHHPLPSSSSSSSSAPPPLTAAPLHTSTSSHPPSQQVASLLVTSEPPLSNSFEKELPPPHSSNPNPTLNGQFNTNENSNLIAFAPVTLLNPEVEENANRLSLAEVEKTPLLDLEPAAIAGVRAELGETLVDESTLEAEEEEGEGKAASESEKPARPSLQAVPGSKELGGGGRGLFSLKDAPPLSLPPLGSVGGFTTLSLEEKLKQLGLDTFQVQQQQQQQGKSDGEEDSVSEDISLHTSTSAKMETEDVSIFSQNSLTGDYDHAEPVQT